jgi:RNase P subunit RPR2
MTTTRVCKNCTAELPLTEEHFRPYKKSGRQYFLWTCRSCEQKRCHERYIQKRYKDTPPNRVDCDMSNEARARRAWSRANLRMTEEGRYLRYWEYEE